MNFFVKYAAGFLRIRLTGMGLERFLNLCGKHDILLWDINCGQNEMECRISVSGFRQIRPLARKTRTKVRIISKSGVPFFFFRYRKRTLFLAGLGLAVFLLVYASGYIWKIDIEGNSRISDEKILRFMQEHAWYYGAKKSRIDPEDVETAIRNQFSEVAWSSISIDGTCMTVHIKENLFLEQEDSSPLAAEGEAVHMVADADGTVVSIMTRRGIPLVESGSQVKAGDVLISGIIPIADAYDAPLGFQGTVASGDVTLQCEIPYRQSFSMSDSRRVYTGREHHYIYVTDVLQRIHFWRFLGDYDRYDVIHEYRQPCIQEHFYLPVLLHDCREREYRLEDVTYTRKEAAVLAKDRLQSFLNKLEEKGIQIIEKNVRIEFADNQCVCEGTIIVHRNGYTMQAAGIPTIDDGEGQSADESQ